MVRLALVLAAVAALAAPAGMPQDDPIETHDYNIEFLLKAVQDWPGEGFGLDQDSIGVGIAVDEGCSCPLPGSDLVSLVKGGIFADTWAREKTKIEHINGRLTVTHRRSVQEKIRQYLDYLHGFFGRRIVVDVAVVALDPPMFSRILAAGDPARPAALSPEQVRQVMEAAREGKSGEVLKTCRLTADPGQRVNLEDAVRQTYVADHDAQVSTADALLDPVLDVFATGTGVDIHPFLGPLGHTVTIEIRAEYTEPEGIEERTVKVGKELAALPPPGGTADAPAAAPRGGTVLHPVELKIQLPRVTRHVVRTMIVAKDRETVLVASPMRRGRNLLFLMTPSVVGLDDKPAVEPLLEDQRLMRFYDVSSFLHAVQDFAGPAMGIGSPSRGGGTPLTGATFTLDEPHARMDSGELVDLIKAKAFPETWGVKGNTIEMGQGRKLLVRQKPEVLKEIDRLLEERFASYARTIAVEAAVVTFRKGALAEWEREIPALGPGGYFAEDEKVRKLMEEAFKGLRVRLLETAEVTAFPLQRVFVGRILTERYVSDYEPQLSSCVSIFDPFVQTLCSGLLLDVRPSFARGADEILLDLRAALTRREFTGDVPTSSGLGAVQALRCTGFRWRANVTCVKGKWTVAGLESRGQGDEAEDVALFLRARPNLLK